MAGGMARRGALPVVHSFACFLSARPNEQIYNQCSERTKVIYVGSLAGLLPGGPGHSHQSVRDISALGGGAAPDADRAVDARRRSHALVDYLRQRAARAALSAAGLGEVAAAVRLPGATRRSSVGRGWVVREGTDVVVCRLRAVAAGQCLRGGRAARRSAGVCVRLVNLPWLNRVDAGVAARRHRRRRARSSRSTTTTCTAARATCWPRPSPGSGSTPRPRVTRLGVTELPECGTNDEVLAHHRLDVAGARRRVRAALPPGAGRRHAGRRRMTVLFWDIDGTLLTTGQGRGAGVGRRPCAR